ncbi:YfjL-like protein [Natronincola ferrireducens]|uniref:Uncharacterized protein n=1 Tax=Natronincola ferrireducens TaxID=393762 RepID=A0A1G9E2C9_9FIRM|nr:hypothetical protein [Natronincola ferrireducens]SDK70258.1 hypothetical protein SAMN05660472_01813 [Natronincola ferrireducens]
MKNNKSALKIVALLVGICLIGGILFIANAFVGNPISAALANKAIRGYVAENYSSLDLEIGKARYNFKFGEYMARAKSTTSIDTHFAIYYRDGKVHRDDYEASVLGKYNTLSRLEDEYSELIIPILSQVPGLEDNRARVFVEKEEYEKINEAIELDMKLDKVLPIDMQVALRGNLDNISLDNIAGILENAHKVLLDHGCFFTGYDVFSEYDGVLVMINDVTPSDIEGGELKKLLQEALDYEDDEFDKVIEKDGEKPVPVKRIRVFIKNDK